MIGSEEGLVLRRATDTEEEGMQTYLDLINSTDGRSTLYGEGVHQSSGVTYRVECFPVTDRVGLLHEAATMRRQLRSLARQLRLWTSGRQQLPAHLRGYSDVDVIDLAPRDGTMFWAAGASGVWRKSFYWVMDGPLGKLNGPWDIDERQVVTSFFSASHYRPFKDSDRDPRRY